jgi:sporulation protein YlmC with PRC-barrel domain
MADDFPVALKKSSINFDKYFKKLIIGFLNGDFEPVEGVTKYKMAAILDKYSGIDLWHFDTRFGVRGVANRIQYNINYKTFTIRNKRESGVKTEYEKRNFAIKNNYLYPTLTFQGYIKDNEVLSFAIAYTKDIIDVINNGHCNTKCTGKEQKGQAEFYVVPWNLMQKLGYKIYIKDFSNVR